MGSDVSSRAGVSPSPSRRRISRTPFKVLDAPALRDDFYLNLVDWSPQNVIAVGLGPCVYLWSASNSRVSKLCDLTGTNSHVCSVAWTQARVAALSLLPHLQHGRNKVHDCDLLEQDCIHRAYVLF